MDMHSCDSSQIRRYGYDAETRMMAVEFHHGGLYHYSDVPPEVFAAFEANESKGSFLHHNIKGKYKFEKQ